MTRGKGPVSAIVVVILSMLVDSNGFADDSALETLKKAVMSQADVSKIRYRGTCSNLGAGFDLSAIKSRLEFEVERDNDRLRIFSKKKLGDSYFHYKQSTYTNKLAVKAIFRGNERPRENYSTAIAYQKDAEDERTKILSVIFQHGFWLDGYLATDDVRVTDQLLESHDLSMAEGKDDQGNSILRFNGTTIYGLVTAELDPARGYAVVRMKIEKNANDIIGIGIKVADMWGHPESKSTKVTHWSAETSKLKLTQVGDDWIADSGVLTLVSKYDQGDEYKIVYSVSRQDIELAPVFDRQSFVPDLEVGASVNFIDAKDSRAAYVWDGDKPVRRKKNDAKKP